MIYYLKSLITIHTILAIFWYTGCQRSSNTPQTWSNLTGSILSRPPIGTYFRPLRIICYQASKVRANPDGTLTPLQDGATSLPEEIDLELVWHQNDVYFASIRKPDFENPLELPQIIKPAGLPFQNYLSPFSKNSVTFESPISEGVFANFLFTYILQWRDGLQRDYNAELLFRHWASTQPGNPDKEYLSCRFESPVTSEPPKINEKLRIEGPVYDAKLKRYVQVSTELTVDVIQESKGQLLLSSLSGNLSQTTVPVNAPVYNAEREIVGYVKSFKKGSLLGVQVLSVHDKGLAAKLKAHLGLEHWSPAPAVMPAVSQRFQELVCKCGAYLKSKQDEDLRRACKRPKNS